MSRRSFCTLATVSPAGRPHVAAVIYEHVADRLYISTIATSRKARNVADQPHVAVVIPVRRFPVAAPPSTIQFQATAALLAVDSDEIVALSRDGRLGAITGHGELDLPGSCVIRIDLPRRLHTYGLGLPLRHLISDPLNASGHVELGR